MSNPIPWLSVVGIRENGQESLSAAARAAISGARLVAGGKRHLELVRELIRGEALPWRSPPHEAFPKILAMRPRPVCVLSTGDPFHYGMGAVLARRVSIEEMQVFPAVSAFSLAAARLGWPLQQTVMIGVNGRPLERLIPHLQPSARLIVLSADETTPEAIAALLTGRGFGQARMTILEHMEGPQERMRHAVAASFGLEDIARLNCVAIEMPAEVKDKALPLASGLVDDWFEHDGQLTKREIRAVTLSALAPRRGEWLWDIGLGAGSVAIEWLLAHADNRAIGIEKDKERAARAARNAKALGVPQLIVMEGEAPAILSDLEAPDAIFIGGGASHPGMIEAVWKALKPTGRLVINAISLETEACLLAAQKQYGGRLIRLGVERAESVGSMTGWRPAMTVMQWSVTK